MIVYSCSEALEYEEFIGFLKRSDLGSQYPKANFEARIPKLLKNLDICITARTEDGLLVGICFGLTDFAYFLFLTDLGVDREYTRRGIGSALVRLAHKQAGGPADISITTISNDDAIEFYKALDMQNEPNLVVKYCTDWTSFVVT